MSVSVVPILPPSAESQAQVPVRLSQAAPRSIPGTNPSGEKEASQTQVSQPTLAEDEVKVQVEPPGEIAVYQFLNQYGSLILQVPPQQMLELAQEISQELAQEGSPKPSAAIGKGESHGH
jgi:hypothetical protein